MSEIADNIYKCLREIFPNFNVMKEHYINTKVDGDFSWSDKYIRLFFDFYIKELGVLIEVQGRQHLEFIKHFHGSRESFLQQKYRDNLKIAYVQGNNELHLVRFYYNEKITKDLVLKKITEVFDAEWGVI